MKLYEFFCGSALVAGLLCSAPASFAQQPSPGGASYVAQTAAKPGCRSVVLHVIREGGQLSGVAFYADGTGVSSVKGMSDGSKFNWTMDSLSGNGPKGDVTGTISPQGALKATLTGTACTLDLLIPRMNEYSN